MAKKKKDKKIELLSKEQEKQLQNMVNGMLDIAATIVEDYSDDLDLEDLHTLSGSVTQINENSPFLSEIFEGDSWKKVMNNLPPLPKEAEDDASD